MIGTILMVAITVVLAAVLYVTVSGLIDRRQPKNDMIVFSVRRAGNNWSMLVTSAPTGLLLSSVTLTIRDANGVIRDPMASVPLSELTKDHWNTYKAYYQKLKSADIEVTTGASILVDAATYSAGSTYDVIGSSSILASGAF